MQQQKKAFVYVLFNSSTWCKVQETFKSKILLQNRCTSTVVKNCCSLAPKSKRKNIPRMHTFYLCLYSHTHTHAHTHMHTHTHTHVRAHTCTHTHARTHTHADFLIRTFQSREVTSLLLGTSVPPFWIQWRSTSWLALVELSLMFQILAVESPDLNNKDSKNENKYDDDNDGNNKMMMTIIIIIDEAEKVIAAAAMTAVAMVILIITPITVLITAYNSRFYTCFFTLWTDQTWYNNWLLQTFDLLTLVFWKISKGPG